MRAAVKINTTTGVVEGLILFKKGDQVIITYPCNHFGHVGTVIEWIHGSWYRVLDHKTQETLIVVLKYDDPCSELTVYGPFKSKETAYKWKEKEHPAKGSINFGQINSESDRQYVILAGSLASGIECYGPFTHDESLGFIGLFKYKYPEIPLQRMALKGHSIP